MLNVRKKRRLSGDAIMRIVGVIAALIWTWWIASFIDIISHNLDPNPVYQVWNFFTLIV